MAQPKINPDAGDVIDPDAGDVDTAAPTADHIGSGAGGAFEDPLPGEPGFPGETGFVAGVERGGKGLVGMPAAVMNAFMLPASTPQEKALIARLPAGIESNVLGAKRLLFDPQYEEWRRAWEEKPMPGDDRWNNATERRNAHVIAAMVPIVGPMAGHLMDLWVKGDKMGALGELLTLGAGAFVTGAAEGAIRTPRTQPPGATSGVPGRTGLMQRGARAVMGIHRGLGPKFVRETVEANRAAETVAAEKTATRRAALEEETKRVKTSNEIATEQANAVNRRIQKDYGEELSQTEYNNLKAQLEAKAQNADEAARYAADAEEAERLKREGKDLETRRGELARDRQQQGSELADQVRTAEKAASGELNKAYKTIDERAGNASMPVDELADTVNVAKTTKLLGSSENISQFESILRRAKASTFESKLREQVMVDARFSGDYESLSPEQKATVDRTVAALMKDPSTVEQLTHQLGEEAPGEQNISFRDLRGYVSEIDKVLRERGGKGPGMLNGDVQQALKLVLNKARQMSLDLADQNGVGDLLRSTNARYKDYIETFHTPNGPSSSGSPIARSLDAKDRAYMIKPLGNLETAARVRGMLERFAPGAVGLFDRFMQTGRELEEARKTKPPKVKEVKPQAPPVVAKETEPPTIKAPTRPKLEEPPSPTAPKYRPVEPKITKVGPDELRQLRGESYDKQVERFRASGSWLVPLLGFETIKALASGEVLRAAGYVRDIPLYIMSRSAVTNFLEREEVRNFIIGTTQEDLEPLRNVPPQYRTQAADRILHLMNMARSLPTQASGRPLVMSPALQAFVYANATKPQRDRRQLMDQGRQLTATPSQQQQQ